MTRMVALTLGLIGLSLTTGSRAQTGEINVFTDLGNPFPPGCLSLDIPDQPAGPDNVLVDQIIPMPSVNSNTRDENVRVQIWRVACLDDSFSVVIVRLDPEDDSAIVLVPQVFVHPIDPSDPPSIFGYQAQLAELPGSGNAGASGQIMRVAGQYWMLAVDPAPLSGARNFVPEDYNRQFRIEFWWGDYSGTSTPNVLLDVDAFEPTLDPPQFSQPVLNGRYTGQWVLDGAPRQGLVLQIAERIEDHFVFAIFFTYLDGEPVWVVGNSTPALIEPGPVTIQMATLQGGAFMADPVQPAREDVIPSDAGSITITPLDCNRIRVDYDFTPLGFGIGSMTLDRLVRIAGYDCNPWQ